MKTTIETIQTMCQTFEEKKDLDKSYSKLMRMCPKEFRNSKGVPNSHWKKSCQKYINELEKVAEWNKISINF